MKRSQRFDYIAHRFRSKRRAMDLEKSDQSARMLKKDWITLIISSLALIVSASALYLGAIRQKDDLRLVVEGQPEFQFDYEHLAFDLSTTLTLTFINSGNRSAAVLDVQLLLDQSPKADLHRDECESEDGSAATRATSSFKPVVVKPGEIVSIEATFGYPPVGPVQNPLPHPIPIDEKSAEKKQINVLGCLRFKVSTPDKVAEYVDIPIFYSNVELYRQDDGYFGSGTRPRLEPRILTHSAWPF